MMSRKLNYFSNKVLHIIAVLFLPFFLNAQTTLFSADFSDTTGDNNWNDYLEINGQWLEGNVATIPGGTGDYKYTEQFFGEYSDNAVIRTRTPLISTVGYSDITLSVDLWYDTETDWDGFAILYSTDGANFFHLGGVADINGTNWFNDTDIDAIRNGYDGWSGNSGGWVTATFNISDFDVAANNNPNLQFIILFGSDGSITETGVALDNFIIQGTPLPVAPEIDVAGNGTSITNGDTTPSILDGTDMGNTTVGNSTTQTFTITNSGTVDLLLNGAPLVAVSGSAEFSVTTAPTTPIASSGSTTFVITYSPTDIGTDTATISIANNDSDENPYTFTIQGTGASPEIDVLGNGVSILDGDTTPDTSDNTDFGSTEIGSSISHIFTISNTGSLALNLTGSPIVNISGGGEFTVTTLPTTPVAVSGTTTFIITYTPTNIGTDTETVTIENDDSDEDPYTFTIEAEGTAAPTIGPGGIVNDLQLWYRADRGLAYTNGQAVATWVNQGRGPDATIPLAGMEPTFRDDVTYNLNFNPTVDFTNDAATTIKDFNYDNTKEVLTASRGFYTQDIFFVTVPDVTPTTTAIIDVFTGDEDPLEDEEDVTGFGFGNFSGRFDDEILAYCIGTNPTPNPAALADRGYGVAHNLTTETYDYPTIINPRNNATATGQVLMVNGNDVGNIEVGVPQFTNVENSKFHIARSEAFTGSYDGRVVEVITYSARNDDATTDSDHNKIETYLAIKYGITLGVNGTSQDYVSADGTIIWDTSVGSYNYDIAGIGNDSNSDFVQKQSKSINSNSVVTIGLGDIYTTNNLNTNAFNDDGDYLVWGNNGAPMTTSTNSIDVNLGPTTVTTITDVLNRVWKVTETASNDVPDVKISVAVSDFVSGLPAVTGNDAYVMVIADDETFTTGLETIFMDTNGANQEVIYNFDGTKYFTFGVAHETVAPRHSTFDGEDNYTRIGDKLDIAGPFSVSAWVFSNGSNNDNDDRTIVSKRGSGNDGYHFFIRNNGELEMRFNNGGSNRIRSNTRIPDNQWRHVAFTFDGTTGRIYIDGVLDNSSGMPTPTNNSNAFTIGARYIDNADVRNFFNGDLDEIRIWNKAMSVDEIRYIMNQEIMNDGGNVGGVIVPNTITRNDIAATSWNDLLAYYDMNSYLGTHLNDVSGNGNRGSLVIPDNFSINTQTAPLPYVSTANGNWGTAGTWENGSDMYIPGSTLTINGTPTPINWGIVRTNHNVTIGNGITMMALINNANEVRMNVDDSLRVTHYLKIDGKLDLEGEAQLLQDVNSELDITSAGSIDRDQQGTANAFTYNYWSSPVGEISTTVNNNAYAVENILFDATTINAEQAINFVTPFNGADGAITDPITLSSHWFYTFRNGPDDDYTAWIFVGSSNSISAGEGFTMKGTSGSSAITDNQNYTFIGKPNNGPITLTLDGGNNYLVGNPYPSAIDAHEFINDNAGAITGTLYFWEHWGGGTHNLADYQGGYAMYNLSGTVGTPTYATSDPDVNSGGTPTKLPGRYIPVSQGFFVVGDGSGPQTVTFDNNQRVFRTESAGVSVFLRSQNDHRFDTSSAESNHTNVDNRMKIRLGFNSPNTIHRQLLLTIDPSTTLGVDWAYDGERNDNQIDDFYWRIDNEDYIIQAIPEINEDTTELPLGVNLDEQGEISITIDALENIPDDVNLYIKDNITGLYHDLRTNDFTINLNEGITTDRFSLVFKNQLLSVDDILADDSIVNYISNTKEIYIRNTNLQNELVQGKLFSIIGQEIQTWDINSNETRLRVKNVSTGNYIFKLITKEGTITKKFVIE